MNSCLADLEVCVQHCFNKLGHVPPTLLHLLQTQNRDLSLHRALRKLNITLSGTKTFLTKLRDGGLSKSMLVLRTKHLGGRNILIWMRTVGPLKFTAVTFAEEDVCSSSAKYNQDTRCRLDYLT